MRSTLIINQKPPHSTMATREALDTALATAAFGVKVGLLFLGDGVFQIHKQQNTKNAFLKNTAGIFNSLALYEIDQVFVRHTDLACRGLTAADLSINVAVISDDQVSDLLTQFDNLLSF